MTPQDDIKLNKAKCLLLTSLICKIQGYWAAYAAKNTDNKLRLNWAKLKLNLSPMGGASEAPA